ncbi:hypothetical protein BU23DRAFT_207671 [Bimuria novae-zelandiae CBS 107.79]|uniref:Uncharacterized protein n=1 Tax=Bimuria novae-zelandiae CBS 107.79 TaxID=1447943 RepID=A0A6A5V2I8_9PLEO|nr:hypothetical protein BU23DRAFT_207671 [Bimuria novae-zelandiae CBS 107.79]
MGGVLGLGWLLSRGPKSTARGVRRSGVPASSFELGQDMVLGLEPNGSAEGVGVLWVLGAELGLDSAGVSDSMQVGESTARIVGVGFPFGRSVRKGLDNSWKDKPVFTQGRTV